MSIGRETISTRHFMEEDSIFADAFNYHFHNGRQVIRPEQLSELDTAYVELPQSMGRKGRKTERYRDILKRAVCKTDGRTVFLLLGIENQLCKALHN